MLDEVANLGDKCHTNFFMLGRRLAPVSREKDNLSPISDFL